MGGASMPQDLLVAPLFRGIGAVDIPNNRKSGGAFRSIESMRRRHAFTMIELVIVIAIILILLGLVIVGMKYIGASSKRGTAKVTLENLRSMYGAYDATVKTKPDPFPIWTTDNLGKTIASAIPLPPP